MGPLTTSIEGARFENAVPLAVPLSRLDATLLSDIADCLGLPESRSGVKSLEAALRDPERTRRRLRGLPAYALLVLEALCEGRGRLRRSELAEALKERTPGEDLLTSALGFLSAHGLAMTTGPGPADSVTLLQPEAATIAEIVIGVGHPSELPAGLPDDPAILSHERQILAVATLAAHRKLRWTRDGAPHRTALKSFVKGLGPDEEEIEGLLHEAHQAGLIQVGAVGDGGEGGTTIAPRALHDAAAGGLRAVRGSLLGTLDALVPESGWIPARSLVPEVVQFGVGSARGRAAEHAVATACRGRFVVREHAGHLFVGRTVRPTARSGDGHVTPNLEVMLGPEAHPEIVVAIGVFAELVRLDRVLTFRITPASVAAGCATGQPLEGFLEALDRVGRHAVPDNVRITVRDFASRLGTMRRLWALEVPASATEALVRELGAAAVGAPRPGLVLAEFGLNVSDISNAMQRVGLHAIPAGQPSPAGPRATPRARTSRPPSPDHELLQRVVLERRSGFAESTAAFKRATPKIFISPERDAQEAARAARDDLEAAGGPLLLVRSLDRLAALLEGVPREIESWAKKLPAPAAREALDATQSPIALIPYASLPGAERRKALSRARSWKALVQLCEAAVDLGLATPAGARVLPVFYVTAPRRPGRRGLEEPLPTWEPEGAPQRRIVPGPDFERDLRELVAAEELATVAFRAIDGTVAHHNVVLTSIQSRGSERVLLAEDLDTEEGHAFPLSKIEWVEVDDDLLEEDLEDPDDDADDGAIERRATPALSKQIGAMQKGAVGAVASATAPRGPSRTGRNAPCPCGSGKKYKRCHGEGS